MGTPLPRLMSSHRFKLGNFECVIVLDGYHIYADPAGSWFRNAPKDELDEELRSRGIDPETWDKQISPYPSLVVFTRKHVVLVDTGAGTLAESTGKLIENLAKESIAPEDIDTVILTHAHPDHIGGITDGNGNPTFTRARYVISRTEWDFWTGDPDLSNLEIPDSKKELLRSYAAEKLLPIQNRLDFVELRSHEAEIVPGVLAIDAAGHTPGHIVISVRSVGEELLYLSDTVVHPIHLKRPEWWLSVDMDQEQTTSTRRRILGRASADGALVHVFHFPAPGLGRVVAKDDAWGWKPIDLAR